VVGPQKVQQERRPVHPIWEKAQKYCDKGNMPLAEALLLERGCHENWRQGFLLERQVKNM